MKSSAVVKDVKDEVGLPLRVLVPDEADALEGVPLSMPLDEIFGHLPVDFRKTLYNELWQRGLIEPQHFVKAGADQQYKRAILAVIRTDFHKLRELAQELISNG